MQCVRHHQNEDQAPPENRHRIAGQGNAHQRLIINAAAPRGGDDAGRNAERDRKDHRAKCQFEGRRKQRQEFVEDRCLGDDRDAEVAMQKAPDIIAELLPDRPVKPHLVHEFGMALGRDAALAAPHLDRISRHQPDHHEGDEHQGDERRKRQRQSPDEESDHEGCLVANKLGASPRRPVRERSIGMPVTVARPTAP